MGGVMISLARVACVVVPLLAAADEKVREIHETFEPIDLKQFLHPIPNKYTEVRNGVLWTRGTTGTAYPPMVFMPVEGKDLAISFRYRHLGEGGWLWFFVDGDDGFGSVDHLLRIKLLRDRIQLEVDGHSRDADHPMRQKRREADPVSKAYRLNELLPPSKIDLSKSEWHTVTAEFHGEEVVMTLDGMKWTETLKRPDFNAVKRKLLFMQNGGDAGIEIDDVHVTAAKDRAGT
ncbi:hypothetical protein Pan44_09950 [Caulifigura coniformis]|uniref:3-keto-disaccharide hydrolase domain-containing protein n=1 Tax=Caulifigura coniformis TaxID=2527983 RepID=A0A517SA34_9PLAN|nr:hypothetical protein Pan44_09950 [Caulifigura coniformis]